MKVGRAMDTLELIFTCVIWVGGGGGAPFDLELFLQNKHKIKSRIHSNALIKFHSFWKGEQTCTHRDSDWWGVCVVVMVAIFSALVSREALEDSGIRKIRIHLKWFSCRSPQQSCPRRKRERKRAKRAVHQSAAPRGLTVQPDANCLWCCHLPFAHWATLAPTSKTKKKMWNSILWLASFPFLSVGGAWGALNKYPAVLHFYFGSLFFCKQKLVYISWVHIFILETLNEVPKHILHLFKIYECHNKQLTSFSSSKAMTHFAAHFIFTVHVHIKCTVRFQFCLDWQAAL